MAVAGGPPSATVSATLRRKPPTPPSSGKPAQNTPRCCFSPCPTTAASSSSTANPNRETPNDCRGSAGLLTAGASATAPPWTLWNAPGRKSSPDATRATGMKRRPKPPWPTGSASSRSRRFFPKIPRRLRRHHRRNRQPNYARRILRLGADAVQPPAVRPLLQPQGVADLRRQLRLSQRPAGRLSGQFGAVQLLRRPAGSPVSRRDEHAGAATRPRHRQHHRPGSLPQRRAVRAQRAGRAGRGRRRPYHRGSAGPRRAVQLLQLYGDRGVASGHRSGRGPGNAGQAL